MADTPHPTALGKDPATKPKRCPVCRGRGAIRCECWPGDCICGWDDEPCEACDGTGTLPPPEDYDYSDEVRR